MKRRLGPMGKACRGSGSRTDAEGLSHADLVKAAEAAAKQALMRGDERVSADGLSAALRAAGRARVGRPGEGPPAPLGARRGRDRDFTRPGRRRPQDPRRRAPGSRRARSARARRPRSRRSSAERESVAVRARALGVTSCSRAPTRPSRSSWTRSSSGRAIASSRSAALAFALGDARDQGRARAGDGLVSAMRTARPSSGSSRTTSRRNGGHGQPLNRALVANIGRIRGAVARGPVAVGWHAPPEHGARWWELWLTPRRTRSTSCAGTPPPSASRSSPRVFQPRRPHRRVGLAAPGTSSSCCRSRRCRWRRSAGRSSRTQSRTSRATTGRAHRRPRRSV